MAGKENLLNKIQTDARRIADMIDETNTDHRGNLLLIVGSILKDRSQHFTGNLIRSAAIEYGVDTEL